MLVAVVVVDVAVADVVVMLVVDVDVHSPHITGQDALVKSPSSPSIAQCPILTNVPHIELSCSPWHLLGTYVVVVTVVEVAVVCVVEVAVVSVVEVSVAVVVVTVKVEVTVVVVVVAVVVVGTKQCLSSFALSRVPLKDMKARSLMTSPAGEEHAIATTESTLPAEVKAPTSIVTSARYSPVNVSFPSKE